MNTINIPYSAYTIDVSEHKKMIERETSDFSMKRDECPRCGAIWLNGVHTWGGTGIKGDEETLHNLVCNTVNDPQCINKKYKKDHIYKNKDTWSERKAFIDSNFRRD